MIRDFFRWWYTNSEGVEYMSFLHCAQEDIPVVIITSILSLVVCILYANVYYLTNRQIKIFPDSLTKGYLKAIMNVFLYCALSGYGYTLISVFINPYKLRILLLGVLIVWTWKFIKSIKLQSSILRIMEGEKALQEKIHTLQTYQQKVEDIFNSKVETKDKLIKYSDLELFPIGVWSEIDGIEYRLIEKGTETLTFETKMPDGSEFDNHYHDCIETCHVKKGELVCPCVGERILKGDSISFKPYEKHRPYARGEVVLVVIFQKPQK